MIDGFFWGGYVERAIIADEDNPSYFQKALHRIRFSSPKPNK